MSGDRTIKEVKLDVWGDYACFTRPEHKVERVTYDAPTPSAMRGVLNAIYCKPIEFYYEITGIDVMREPKVIDIRKLEVYKKAGEKQVEKPFIVDEIRTRRHTVYLKDVYYRVYANIHKREDIHDPRVTIESITEQFYRRVRRGQCFYQPFLGLKECMCFFDMPDENETPINLSKDLGIMLYDVFDIEKNIKHDTRKRTDNTKDVIQYSFYHPYMINGHISVPGYHSGEIMRKELS